MPTFKWIGLTFSMSGGFMVDHLGNAAVYRIPGGGVSVGGGAAIGFSYGGYSNMNVTDIQNWGISGGFFARYFTDYNSSFELNFPIEDWNVSGIGLTLSKGTSISWGELDILK